jgi:RNA polymerase-binding transcription factor DksA
MAKLKKIPPQKSSHTQHNRPKKNSAKTASKAAVKSSIRKKPSQQKGSKALAAKKIFSNSKTTSEKTKKTAVSKPIKSTTCKEPHGASTSQKNDAKKLAKEKKGSTVATPTLRSISLAKATKEHAVSSKSPLIHKTAPREMSQSTGAKNVMKRPEISEETKKLVLNARKRVSATPAFVRAQQRKATPIVFTLDDVRNILVKRTDERPASSKTTKRETPTPFSSKTKSTAKPVAKEDPQTRSFSAASIADILGFNPRETTKRKPISDVSDRIPKKFLKYYNLLIKLRDHVAQELNTHSEETLKRSSKEDSGDISSYSQHLADAGTDTFDRDFALSLVSSEQEALNEIEDAIQRMLSGTYGVCEITGDKITHERLTAVPFTRFSLEGQRQHEKTQRKTISRVGIFGSETTVGEVAGYGEEES